MIPVTASGRGGGLADGGRPDGGLDSGQTAGSNEIVMFGDEDPVWGTSRLGRRVHEHVPGGFGRHAGGIGHP